PAEGAVVAHGLPGATEARRHVFAGLGLRHGQPSQAKARRHPEQSGHDEGPSVADPIEELAGGQRESDSEHRARHANQPQGATALSARIDALYHRGLSRRDGGAEEIAGDYKADEGPRRAD